MIISLQRIENLALAAVIAIAYIYFGFPWWSLLAMFLVFYLSALGYLHSPRSGALWYNLVYNYTAPALFGTLYILFALTNKPAWILVFLAGTCASRIAVVLALGYGLILPDSFPRT